MAYAGYRDIGTKPYRTGVYSERVNSSKWESIVGKSGMGIKPAYRNGGYLTISGVSKILQSIYIILSTPKGTRFFNPEFGTRIYQCLFEPNDFILKDLLKTYVVEDLQQQEPRCVFDAEVKLERGSNKAEIKIKFAVKGTEDVYEYKYYVNRGDK